MAGGTTVRALLANATEDALRSLMDPVALAVLDELKTDLTTPQSLRRIVIGARSSKSYLEDDRARRIILDLLDDQEAVELCKDLGLTAKEQPKAKLKNLKKLSAAQQDSLWAFFGIDALAARHTIAPDPEVTADYALFKHQRDALHRVVDRLYSDSRRLVLHMPTGAGKTRTAMHLVSRHFREYEPAVILWLAFSRELLEQAASEFERAWSHLGNRTMPIVRFWGNYDQDLTSISDGLIVAGLGKLHAAGLRDGNLLPSVADATSLTVIDEAHQAVAPTFAAILTVLATKNPNAALLGLTATPGRTYSDVDEDARLSDFFAKRKVRLEVPGYDNPVKYLIAEKYLANPEFRTVSILALSLSARDAQSLGDRLDLPDEVASQVVAKEAWTLAIVRETEGLLSRHKRVIVFATTKDHALLLATILRARGCAADAVTGETSPFDRQAILQRYVSNDPEPMVIFNFGVLTTGFDAPATSAVVIARPTRSLVLYSQMVGRALRGTRAGGNETAEIVTVIDPSLPGFGDPAEAFANWEDVWE